jgi:hypothetical protein
VSCGVVVLQPVNIKKISVKKISQCIVVSQKLEHTTKSVKNEGQSRSHFWQSLNKVLAKVSVLTESKHTAICATAGAEKKTLQINAWTKRRRK